MEAILLKCVANKAKLSCWSQPRRNVLGPQDTVGISLQMHARVPGAGQHPLMHAATTRGLQGFSQPSHCLPFAQHLPCTLTVHRLSPKFL